MMKLLLPIEIHVAVCELQATHGPTIAGLLLQDCVIQVSLLRGLWNSGAALADVHRGAARAFGKQYKGRFLLSSMVVPRATGEISGPILHCCRCHTLDTCALDI